MRATAATATDRDRAAGSDAVVDDLVERLTETFETAPSKRDAHRRSARVLGQLPGDERFLGAILARHLRRAGSLNKGHYPVIGIEIAATPHFELVAHAWLPLPDGNTNLSTKAIHHHGELLLTTTTIFGPGYEHWMLTHPRPIDAERSLYSMELVERGQHGYGETAFVDAYVAHLPLYPPSLTITVCLWSSRQATTWRDSLKRVGVLRRHSAALRRVATRLGLARALKVKNVSYFDFYPTSDGFVGMPEREEFELGPNEDYLQSLFHVIQATGNGDLGDLVEARLDADGVTHPERVRELLGELRAGKPIEPRLSPAHVGIPHANFPREAIEDALAATRDPQP